MKRSQSPNPSPRSLNAHGRRPRGVPAHRGDTAHRVRRAPGTRVPVPRPQPRQRGAPGGGAHQPLLRHRHLGCAPAPSNTKKFGSGKNGLEINAHHGSARRTCFPVLPHISKLPVTEMRKQQPSLASGRGSGRNL